ncbi:10171_t:CDS:2, partial [Funneliformis geosporum]
PAYLIAKSASSCKPTIAYLFGNEELNGYIWNWWAFLVQKPEKKPRTILVLKSTLQQCGKNIITDFIGDKVLGQHLHYATSDLEKILGRFNSAIQARKLIVMNETDLMGILNHS